MQSAVINQWEGIQNKKKDQKVTLNKVKPPAATY